MTDAELIAYWRYQAMHYKGLSQRLHQALEATKNTPELHTDIDHNHKDPTGNTAARRADKKRR